MKDYRCYFEPMMRTPCNYCGMQQYSMPQYAMPENIMPQYEMPENTMPQHMMKDNLEGMYPKIYMMVYPHVKHHCDMMEMKHGHMHHHKKEELEEMCENIYKACEKEFDEYMKEDEEHEHEHDHDHRQYGYGRRRFGRDLINILLIRELLARRRRPYGYPGWYPPYGYDYDFEYSD